MSLAELAPSLHALPLMDKIMALQLLSDDLSAEQSIPFVHGGYYPIDTPEVGPGAEDVLLRLLEEDHPA